jgi:hypothetical protein
MSRFCDTLKLFKVSNLRILLNDLWTLAYDGVEAKEGLAPAFPTIRTWWTIGTADHGRRPLVLDSSLSGS